MLLFGGCRPSPLWWSSFLCCWIVCPGIPEDLALGYTHLLSEHEQRFVAEGFFVRGRSGFLVSRQPATGHCVDFVVGVFDFWRKGARHTQSDTMRPAHTTMRALCLLMTHCFAFSPVLPGSCLPGDGLVPPDLNPTLQTKHSAPKSTVIYHRDMLPESRLSAGILQTKD